MFKVKDKFIQKLYRSNLSNFEQLILLELAFRSDEKGRVHGIYYKDIIGKIGCSTAQFYNILESLEEKDFIIADKSNEYYGDWDIVVFDNDFSHDKVKTQSDKYRDFSDLNRLLFEMDNFKSIKAGARRVLIYILFRVLKQKYNEENKGLDENKKNRLKYTSKFNKYKTMSKEIGISERACKEYLDELVKAGFISVGNKINIEGKKFDVITLLASVLKVPCIEVTSKGKLATQKRNHLHIHLEHFVKTMCRRCKVITDKLNLTNTSVLILQYKTIATKKGKDIYNIATNAIKSMTQELSSRTVHSIIKELVNKNYNESILVF